MAHEQKISLGGVTRDVMEDLVLANYGNGDRILLVASYITT